MLRAQVARDGIDDLADQRARFPAAAEGGQDLGLHLHRIECIQVPVTQLPPALPDHGIEQRQGLVVATDPGVGTA